jgi:NTP pyrophosphatase (non-canonical NTP hydrolase)
MSDFGPTAQTDIACLAVHRERRAQDAKWGPQDHDATVWLAILAEEVGEAAQEVLTQRVGKEAGNGHGDLREEVVQIAAVAVAWIEALDREARNDEG